MNTLTEITTFTILTCECGVKYGLDDSFIRNRKQSHATFYCPNGCNRHYPGKTKSEKRIDELETRLERTQSDADFWMNEEAIEREKAIAATRTAAAYKGHLTRMRNRVARGVCPQSGCKRSFEDLAQHVHTCHPELVESLTTSSAVSDGGEG